MPDDIEKELIEIAADLLCGPNPSIPYPDANDDGTLDPEAEADRRGFAFECAKEMLIECINEREFNDMNGGRIANIVRRREHKHVKGNG